MSDPCNLIGRFRHTGFFATQGHTLGDFGFAMPENFAKNTDF